MKLSNLFLSTACVLTVCGCSSGSEYDDLPKNSVGQNQQQLDKIKSDKNMPDYMKNAILKSKPAIGSSQAAPPK